MSLVQMRLKVQGMAYYEILIFMLIMGILIGAIQKTFEILSEYRHQNAIRAELITLFEDTLLKCKGVSKERQNQVLLNVKEAWLLQFPLKKMRIVKQNENIVISVEWRNHLLTQNFPFPQPNVEFPSWK